MAYPKTHLNPRALTPANSFYQKYLRDYAALQLTEDMGPIKRDITSLLLPKSTKKVQAQIIAKENGIFAGKDEVLWYCKKWKIQARCLVKDGAKIQKGKTVFELKGHLQTILTVERFIMNLIQRMSGIATKTNEVVKKLGKNTLLCSTRKTYLGLIDKKAVVIGGGGTHRLGLWDAILIKDNHIAASSIPELIKGVFCSRQKFRFAEIEASSVSEVHEILITIEHEKKHSKKRFPWVIMLDNFPKSALRKTIELVHEHKCLVELSGNISDRNIAHYKKYKADIISSGALTHSAAIIDFSLKIC